MSYVADVVAAALDELGAEEHRCEQSIAETLLIEKACLDAARLCRLKRDHIIATRNARNARRRSGASEEHGEGDREESADEAGVEA